MNQAVRGTNLVACALVVLLVNGCVERRLLLRSDPPGAMVSVNGTPAGLTPTDVPFMTYGHFEIIMSAPGHHRLCKTVPVTPPWWETMPLDLLVENVWPFVVADARIINLTLRPFDAADEAGANEREAELRRRVEAGEGE